MYQFGTGVRHYLFVKKTVTDQYKQTATGGIAEQSIYGWETDDMSFISLVAIVVDSYDSAIRFFVDVLGFELAEDVPSRTNDGRPKRWVVVRPPNAETGILLAQADGPVQSKVVGQQVAGRVGFFLRVDDFEATYKRMVAASVEFVSLPRTEPYGTVAVFKDIAGNRWDLLGT